jgi:WD40 repeat protein
VKVWAVAGDPDQIVYRGHSAKVKVNDVTFSPDGRLAASAAEDGSVHVWQPADGKPIHAWQAHTRALCLRFSRDGRRLATGGADGMLKIWDCATWQLVREMGVFSGLVGRIECVAFSPDGSLIAAGSDDKKVTLWNVDDGTRVGTFRDHTHRVNALAFSPDGQRILSAAGTVVPPTEPEWYLWNVSTRQRQRTFSLAGRPGTAEDAAYSRDGRWLAAAGPDHLVRVWDADTGRLVFQGEGPSGHAPYREAQGGPRQKNFTVGVSFSPDGRRLASADRAQVVKIWDTLSGLPLLSLPPLQTRVSAVAFSPDGQRLAVAGHDGTVRTLAATWP